jgi:hypothetical protein
MVANAVMFAILPVVPCNQRPACSSYSCMNAFQA